MRPARLPRIVLALLLLAVCAAPAAAQERWWNATLADSAMVVSAKAEATETGLEILRQGGNAVDAAIAVHFALAATYPYAGNLGGGGFLVYRAPDGEVHTFDFRERAPLAATRDMYLDASGNVVEGASWLGAKAIGTPGSVAGMALVHEKLGTLPWKDLLAPAIRLAEEGFVVDYYTANVIREKADDIRRFPDAAAILLPGGSPPAPGDTLRQPQLAWSLRQIAEKGPAVFYTGAIADSIAAVMARDGGLITKEDLAAYEAKERPPVSFDYRGFRIWSMGPPSSGGLTLEWILEQLSTFDMAKYPFHSAASVHRLIEAMRRAFAERNVLLGDPDFVTIPDSVKTEAYGRRLAASIDTLHATPSATIRPELSRSYQPTESTQTTHFSIVDPAGGAVAETTTLNGWFGSLETAAGIFLNDEMDDFTVKPGVPNAYGLVQGEANSIQPGKRMLSAMTPTIVEKDGRLRYVVGTPGGSTIITTVANILIDAIDYGMSISEAVDAARIHHQHLPDRVFVEPFGLSADTVERLEAMGHDVRFRGDYSGRAEGIEVLPESGLLLGRTDPRGNGLADGF